MEINYTAPINKTFMSGSVLNLLAFKSGYTVEERTVTVKDTSKIGAATQTIVLFLSAKLVRKIYFVKSSRGTSSKVQRTLSFS